MKLKELLSGLEILSAAADLETEIGGVCYDSRQVEPGDLFVALSGYTVDGHKFISQAMASGAAAVLCQVPPEGKGIPYVQTADSRRALAAVGANFFAHPARDMTMVGVTGTNGKTTSTYLLKAILEARGEKVGLIGTNQNMIGQEVLPTERTTPESFELQKLFARMRDAGCTHVVMEVSSHALFLDRVYGVPYKVGVFTNLTQDHLDFHKTMEDYCDAKAILFRNCETGVVNAADPWTARLLKDASCKIIAFSSSGEADLQAEDAVLAADHVAFMAVCGGKRVPVRVNIPGHFMIDNALDVLGAALVLGIPLEESAAVLTRVPHVKGRVEVVPTPGDYTMLIDYAHNAVSMENLLSMLRAYRPHRLICLFGGGGNRSRLRRYDMGEMSAKFADLTVLTMDNPRDEEVEAINEDIKVGLARHDGKYISIPDRAQAIRWVIDQAQDGDIIALIGKGHEEYQEIRGVKHFFSEEQVALDYLAGKKQAL